ncbi:TonB family protein [Rubrivirga sp.]|uniref:TonB family protein n=1 Tax=Rubrivirga sp. TaxID=1885344 RepID=UPI003B52CE35
MTELLPLLADLGRASVASLWLPVAAWTAVALAVEAALRVGRASAALALPVRGATLAALPLAVAVPAALGAVAPNAAVAVASFTPDVIWLPGVSVGAPEPAAVAAGPAGVDMALGAAVLGALALALVRLVQFGRALVAVGRTRRGLPEGGADARAAVDAARRRLGVVRPVRAAQAPAGAAPFTVGWRAPLVALPPGLDADALDVAAVHEVAHVRRADYAWHAAQRLVTAVFAAHPLAWTLGRGLDLDRERAADAAVLATCPDRRRAYADLLFSYAALPAPALALGTVRGSSSLKTRIDAMTRPLSPTRARRLGHLGRLSGLLVAAAVVVGAVGTASRPATAAAPVPSAVAALDTTDVYEIVDEMPELIGGLEGIQQRLDYPELQYRAGVQGTAVLQFIVSTEGEVTDLQVIRSAGNDGLDRAAIVAVQDARFRPGRQGGEAVRVRFAVPVTFRIGDAPARPERRAPVGEVRPGDPEIFEVAEVQPELIGGLAGLQERVVYPPLAREAGIEGQVVVQFVVNEQGRVEDATVLRTPDEILSEAALAAVRGLTFRPGRDGGQPVKVRFAVPITFRLPPGDGVDRGQRLPSPGEVRQRLPHWGTALNLLENEQLVQTQHAHVLRILDNHNAVGGTATVRYTLLPDGRTTDLQMVEDTPDGVLGGLTRGLVGMMQFAENRRPGEPLEGATFSLQYSPAR